MPVERLYVFFANISIQFLCPFLKQVVCLFVCLLLLNCMNCLHILDINPLWFISFTDIFPHSRCCLFILSMIFFAVQKFSSLVRSHLLIFCFYFLCFKKQIKKITVLLFILKSVTLLFHLCFLLAVLWFPILHLGIESISILFLYVVLENFQISLYSCPVFPAPLIKETDFRYCIFLPPLS